MIGERIKAGLRNTRSKGKRLGRPEDHRYGQDRAAPGTGLGWKRIAKQLGLGVGTAVNAAHRDL